MATKIEWTEITWNPVTGCTKISDGCKNCYAEKMAIRLLAMGTKGYENGFEVTCHPERLQEPYNWKKPKMVFVCSMSDLFHEKVPFDFIEAIWNAMYENQQHIFQILTKRPEEIEEIYQFDSITYMFTDNIWLGVTIENNDVINRIDVLRKIPAKVKFLSCEPLLSALPNLDLKEIDWVICGAESGAKKRLMKTEWAIDLMRQCKEAGVPFFMKQMFSDKGNKLKFEEFPQELQIREYPEVK